MKGFLVELTYIPQASILARVDLLPTLSNKKFVITFFTFQWFFSSLLPPYLLLGESSEIESIQKRVSLLSNKTFLSYLSSKARPYKIHNHAPKFKSGPKINILAPMFVYCLDTQI